MSFQALAGSIMVKEVCKGKGHSDAYWVDLFNIFAQTLLNNREGFEDGGPTYSSKSALAIVIVASRSFSHFEIALKLLSRWENTGGCFWVVVVELFRYYALDTFDSALALHYPSKSIVCKTIKEFLCTAFSEQYCSRFESAMTTKQLKLLRTELDGLLTSMKNSTDPKATLKEYKNKKPWELFLPWFLDWAQPLLEFEVSIDEVDVVTNESPVQIVSSTEETRHESSLETDGVTECCGSGDFQQDLEFEIVDRREKVMSTDYSQLNISQTDQEFCHQKRSREDWTTADEYLERKRIKPVVTPNTTTSEKKLEPEVRATGVWAEVEAEESSSDADTKTAESADCEAVGAWHPVEILGRLSRQVWKSFEPLSD